MLLKNIKKISGLDASETYYLHALSNLNVIITNLSTKISNGEYDLLSYIFKQGAPLKPKDNEIFALLKMFTTKY